MRKKFALIIAAFILNLSIITSYCVPVNAMPISPISNGLYETFSQIFGHSLGTFKETDSLGYYYTLEKMKDFFEHQLLGQPYYWEDDETKELININLYEGCLDLMNNALSIVRGFNAGSLTSDYLYALNELSYSSTGTMASVTLEEKILNGIALVQTMGKVKFETNFENFKNTLFGGTDESGAVLPVTNLASNYELFEALTSSLMTMSEYDSANEYFTPVNGSVFNYSDLSKGELVIGDVALNFEVSSTKSTNLGFYTATSTAYIFVFKDGIIFIADNDFGVKRDSFSYSYAEEIVLNNKTFYYYDQSGSFRANDLSVRDYRDIIKEYYSLYLCNNNFMADKITEIGGTTPGLKIALDAFLNKDLTAEDMVNLADDLDAVGSSVGTEQAIQNLIDVINGVTVTLPDKIVDGKNDVVTAVDGLGAVILTLPKAIWKEFAGVLEDINTKVGTQAQTKPWEGNLNEDSPDILPIFNALIILLQIIIALLRIFIHCLQFIINIFAIQPSSAMFPEEMVMGLEYINTIQVPGLGMSIYSFMMGLVYITIVFFAIRILRVNVDRIKIPKKLNGGL